MGDKIPRTGYNVYNYGDRDAWYAGLPTWNSKREPSAVFLDVNRLLLPDPSEEEELEKEIKEMEESLTPESIAEIIERMVNNAREFEVWLKAEGEI